MTKNLLYKVVYPTEHFGKGQVQENKSSEGKHTPALRQQVHQAAECSQWQEGRCSPHLTSFNMKHTLLQQNPVAQLT